MKEQCLFVGGVGDREMIEVDCGVEFWVLPKPYIHEIGQYYDYTPQPILKEERYKRSLFYTSEVDGSKRVIHSVFLLDGISTGEMFRMLLDNYRK